jgi:hypothetical protein
MIKLTINPNFRGLINNLLINSNKLHNNFYLLNNNLLINKTDVEIVTNLLEKNNHPYKVSTKQ